VLNSGMGPARVARIDALLSMSARARDRDKPLYTETWEQVQLQRASEQQARCLLIASSWPPPAGFAGGRLEPSCWWAGKAQAAVERKLKTLRPMRVGLEK